MKQLLHSLDLKQTPNHSEHSDKYSSAVTQSLLALTVKNKRIHKSNSILFFLEKKSFFPFHGHINAEGEFCSLLTRRQMCINNLISTLVLSR